MNLLSKSEVFAENKLFATLDTTVRKVIVDNLPFLLSDTGGFIRKLLPIWSIRQIDTRRGAGANLLLHIVDISHPAFEEQIEVVNKTLQEVCDSTDKPMRARVQQNRRIFLCGKSGRRPHPENERKHYARRMERNVDGKNARQLHFHIGQKREKEHRRIENAALSTGERDTYDEVPLQRFPVSTLRRNNDRRRILNP